jgi:DNA-binding CsgD family transcriptional regulator
MSNHLQSRKPNSPYIKAVRSMVRADIESLRQPSARVRIQKLSDSHHIMARLIASGLSTADIAAETGYSIGRVSVLRNSPAMQELVAKYRCDDHAEWRKHRDATYEYMHRIRIKSLRRIEDAIDDDDCSPVFALKALDSMADRTNYHRKTTKENINVDFAARLEFAISQSRKVMEIEE